MYVHSHCTSISNALSSISRFSLWTIKSQVLLSLLLTARNVMDAFVAVIFAVTRPTNAGPIAIASWRNWSTINGTPCVTNSAWRNALPPASYVHSKVTLSPSTTLTGLEGADDIVGACDSKRQKIRDTWRSLVEAQSSISRLLVQLIISYPWKKFKTNLLRVQIEQRKTAQKYSEGKKT